VAGALRARGADARPEALPGADLTGANLDEIDLSGRDLRGILLRDASLVATDLRGADLRDADLRDADLSLARLDGARLGGARLDGAILDGAGLSGADLVDASVRDARFQEVRGLDEPARVALAARGAHTSTSIDARWSWLGGLATAAAAAAVLAIYLGGRLGAERDELDAAALEQQATELQQSGKPGDAAASFEALSEKATDPRQKVDFLVEAAGAWQEAGELGAALADLEKAMVLAEAVNRQGPVMLALAHLRAKAGLTAAAARDYAALVQRLDLTALQLAEAVVGLAETSDDPKPAYEAQFALLDGAATEAQRASLALALADAWSARGDSTVAREVLERALAPSEPGKDRVDLSLRLGRVLTEAGAADEALATYLALMAQPGGDEARLGAAELLGRRGADDEAEQILAPMLESADNDLRSRALVASAAILEGRGDMDGAIARLRSVLDMDGLEPRLLDQARIALARLDPAAAEALVATNPSLADELLLGRARALRDAGKRSEARELWVKVAEDLAADAESRVDAGLAIAEMEVEEADYAGALARYEGLRSATTDTGLRQRITLGMANALVRSSKLQEAESVYRGLAEGTSGEIAAQAQLGLARTAELRGQARRAEELYAQVGAQEGPWGLEALDALGRLRQQTGDLPGAVDAWRLARSRTGAEPARRTAVAIELAQALDALGDAGATDVYRELLAAPDPEVRVAARVAVADRMLAADAQGAQALYTQALAEASVASDRAAARAGWLRASITLGQAEAGLARLDAWLATETDSALRAELAFVAVKALRSEGRLDDAARIGVQWQKDGGFELAMELGGVLRDLRRPEKAAGVLASVTGATAEDEGWRLETLADAWMEAGDLEKARASLARLAELPGGQAASAFSRARLAREAGDYEAALALLAESEDPRAIAERALVLEGLGRWDEAETAFRRMAVATDLEQRSAGVVGAARVALERGDAGGAVTLLDGLPVVDPGYQLTVAQVRGEALLSLDRIDEARAVYRSLTGDAESRTVGALGLGACALAAGDPATARQEFARALKATSDRYYQAHALAGTARAWSEAGDDARAREVIQQLRRDYPEREDALAEAGG
jgi:tetratricopeptide (TPR) repeat protein